ncbi:MAG: twin-arginine translocase TatA/TatE family subunit [Pyrinomonadaceae bacterium]
MLGTTEIILIVVALFLLFGASRLPKLAKSIGQSRRAFKEGLEEAEREFRGEEEEKKRLSEVEAPKIAEVSDDELMSEMRRRAEAKEA